MASEPADNGPGETITGAASSRQEALVAADPIQTEPDTFLVGAIRRGVIDIPEVEIYRRRIGAEHRGMRKLAVVERAGKYPIDLAVIKFGDDGEIDAPEGFKPKDDEKAAIKAAWSRYKWPEHALFLFTGRELERDVSRFPFQRATPDCLYEYWDERREHLLMVEERRDNEDGSKDFYPWTYWSDDIWRIAEPDILPLYNLPALKGAITVFVHEGAKAARSVHRLIADAGLASKWEGHPWGETLRGQGTGTVAHLGWTGGARRASATDFSPLRRAGVRVIFIADNDREGIDAIRDISRHSRLKMEAVIFNDEWPGGFDLANPFPPDRIEAGTQIDDLLTPATWATDEIHTGARTSYVIRPEAIDEWQWTVTPPLFFHSSASGRGFTETEVDAMARPFSDAEMTARLIRRNLSARADGVAYLPGSPRVIERDGQRKVNLWTPARLKDRAGSAWPLARLLVSRFPDRDDRRRAIRWGATLSAVPTTRMEYAVLLQSETQGTGKTTLTSIMAALVGEENVSRPNESILTEGNFNGHFAKKRLVIVDEIYSGHSRKTYNRLKSPITDKRLRVNEKYQPEYEIDNFAHFIFSSNDLIAMLIDNTDRRFFIPRMSETKLPPAFWRGFYAWLHGDGFGIIQRCAREWVAKHGAVRPGEAAPMSSAKAEMIERSKSDAMHLIRDAARDLIEMGAGDSGQRIAVTMEDFRAWYSRACKDAECRALNRNRMQQEVIRAGLFIRGRDDAAGIDLRVKIDGRKVPVLSNFDADQCEEPAEAVRNALTSMDKIGFRGPPM